MTRRLRDIVVGACAVAALVSIVLFVSTGARWYSRHPDPQLDAMNQESDLSSLFESETGSPADGERVRSEYAFGFFPGGPSLIDMWSVASVGGPALFVAGGVAWLHRRRLQNASQSAETQE